ncbi:MAG: hypothetical protein D6784_04510 [Chloroflexi bacterium]|nr:MAG: hypothetical protein D6784_04510 [Chloroflexota bacterium]
MAGVESAEAPVVEEELPDWLAEVEEEAEEAVAGVESAEAPVVEEELPDWLAEVEEEAKEPVFEEETAVPEAEQLPEWLEEIQAAEEEEIFEPSEAAPEDLLVEAEAEEAVEELPDWLQEAPEEVVPDLTIDRLIGEEEPVEAVEEAVEAGLEEEAGPEITPEPVAVEESPTAAPAEMPDWLKKLRKGDVDQAELAQPVVAEKPVAEPLAQVAYRPPAEPAKEEPEAPPIPEDVSERLRLARLAREDANVDEALRLYESLVSSGAHLDEVIQDLQEMSTVYPDNATLFQIMGDAMMKDGRLKSALEAYRQALAKL